MTRQMGFAAGKGEDFLSRIPEILFNINYIYIKWLLKLLSLAVYPEEENQA